MPNLLNKFKLLQKKYRYGFLTKQQELVEFQGSEDTVTGNEAEYGYLEGRKFVIGRIGHIRIDDQTVSMNHAQITFTDGMIKLTDLGSTNGTYVEKYGKFVPCTEMYISAKTRIMLGDSVYSVKSLLELSEISILPSDKSGGIDKLSKSDRKSKLPQ